MRGWLAAGRPCRGQVTGAAAKKLLKFNLLNKGQGKENLAGLPRRVERFQYCFLQKSGPGLLNLPWPESTLPVGSQECWILQERFLLWLVLPEVVHCHKKTGFGAKKGLQCPPEPPFRGFSLLGSHWFSACCHRPGLARLGFEERGFQRP